jgi:hypothetical protein
MAFSTITVGKSPPSDDEQSQASASTMSGVIVKTEDVDIVKMEDVEYDASSAMIRADSALSQVEPAPTIQRSHLEEQIYKCRVILGRFVKNNLSLSIPLSADDIPHLARVIHYCGKLGRDAQPFLEKHGIVRAFRHVLRSSRILPDFIPPQIEMVIDAWSRGEYNFHPATDYTVADDAVTDDESVTSPDDDDFDQSTAVIPAPSKAMRGIIISRGPGGGVTYLLDKAAQRPANVFGHNSLQVGAWWPLQICALRDGAHGSRMGGIYGKIGEGAYSIILSGGGSDYHDRDLGDVIWYTGSGETRGADQPLTNANKSLVVSRSRQNAVRVIRTSRAGSQFAPSQGLRYDGLYQVRSYGLEDGAEGFKVWKFQMVRMENQDPIRRDIPTRAELSTLH